MKSIRDNINKLEDKEKRIMPLVRYNPWKEMNTLQRQLNQLFDDGLLTNLGQELKDLTYVPSAELSETNDSILLKLELPGMNPQIKVREQENGDRQVREQLIKEKGDRGVP